jgi:hypothetical protein
MIVVGSRYYASDDGGNRRQQRARAAILAASGVVPVNLQFTDETLAPEGFHTWPVLAHDSRTVTGATGARMPIMTEMLDRLAEVASERGCRAFMFVNADNEVTQQAVDWVAEGRHDAYAFSRADLDPATGTFAGMMIRGIDAVAFTVDWWRRERRRFRPYISGPPYWDNVFAAVICTHGRGDIVSDRKLIYHQQHPSTWAPAGAFAEYNGYLAALDAPYFSRWADYIARLEAAGAPAVHVDAAPIREAVFNGPLLSPAGRVWHAGRQVRARVRYAWHRPRRLREAQ